MRILLINHYAGSPEHGMEHRPFYFAREWVRAGHQVLLLCASFSHLRQVNPTLSAPLQRDAREGVEYLWIRTPPYDGNGTARVRNMVSFVSALRMRCGEPIEAFRPELVIASSTYTWDNWVAARYAEVFQAKYVYEVHDLWPLSPIELGGMSTRNPFIWSLQRAEDFACRRADRVVSLLPCAKEHLIEHGMAPEKFVYIPNGVLPEEWDTRQPVPESHLGAIEAVRRDARFVVGYAGGHALSNALDVLVEAGSDKRLGDVHIVCVGAGAEKARLQDKANALGSRVSFLPPVPKTAIPALLTLFDTLYIGWTRSSLYRFGISPNKLFEYMMAGVPILHGVDAANDPVADSGCGISVPPEDPEALRDGILQIMSLSPGERLTMGTRGRDYVLRYHNLPLLARQFLESISETADSSGGRSSSQA